MHVKVAQSSESTEILAHRLDFSHLRRKHEYGLSFLTYAMTSSSPFLSMSVSFNTINFDRKICIAQSLFYNKRLLNQCSTSRHRIIQPLDECTATDMLCLVLLAYSQHLTRNFWYNPFLIQFHICMDPTMLRRTLAMVPFDTAAESC